MPKPAAAKITEKKQDNKEKVPLENKVSYSNNTCVGKSIEKP